MWINKIKSLLTNLWSHRQADKQPGLGTFYGVYLPGVLTMFGVIIYLRLGYIVGSLGFAATVGIVSLACFIVFITVLSIASTATNMQIKGGGTYYMVSRSLGIEAGSAIGVPLLIAQTLTISFCCVGFAESIHPFFPDIPVQYLGVGTLLALVGLVYFSAELAVKSQLIIFLVIIGSLASLFFGKEIPADETNSIIESGKAASFWIGFAIFFPAATGVEAGVSMSGDLRSPRRSLPIGTMAVLITGYIAYIAIPYFLSTHAPKALLIEDTLIFQHVSRFEPLIIAGIWAATLSSSLACLLAAPRTLQALSRDGILPRFMGKEWGKKKEPRLATIICSLIALLGIYYGSIDKIAPILTMFYLIAYSMLNLAAGLEELMGNPSWRPTFRIPWYVSMCGVALCMMAMLMIDAGATFMALFFVIGIYIFMRRRKIAGSWDDIRYGVLMFLSRFVIYRLARDKMPVRSWRPNFLVLSDSPSQVSNLINLTSAITKDKGFLTLASIFPPNIADIDRAERWKKVVNNYLHEKHIEALVEFSIDDDVPTGAKRFLINYGIGSLSPNTVVLGDIDTSGDIKNFLSIIRVACEAKKNVVIVREKATIKPVTRKVDIWWDEESRYNSELMILLGHMLRYNKKWKRSTLRLNSIVPNEIGKEQRLKYFEEFFMKSRMHVHPEVYIGDKSADIRLEMMHKCSKDADIVLIGLRPPEVDETIESYEAYYKRVDEETAGITNAAFVIGAEQLDLSEIFV